MTHLQMVVRSLIYFRRTHAGIVLGTAIGAAVLVGSLLTGDSVRGTLRSIAMARIGQVQSAMSTNDRFFRSKLADSFKEASAVLAATGIATTPESASRANRVQVLGVDHTFWQLAPASSTPLVLNEDQIAINQRLAAQLGVAAGDWIILRMEKPSLLPRDMPLAQLDDMATALRLNVKAVIDDDQFGRFNLFANQAQPHNAFVSRQMLASRLGLPGKANLLLTTMAADTAASHLRKTWTMQDAQLEVHPNPQQNQVQISSDRVFIDEVYAAAFKNPKLILTYFVNRIGLNDHVTPYSTVAAISGIDLKRDEILINQWLADDLNAQVGSPIDLAYYVPRDGRQLVEQKRTFRVAGVLPMDDPTMDPSLMPSFPGLSDAEHCRQWDAGFPVDYELIRDKDEAYWSKYRGTPKAIIHYDAGKAIWGNRFGALTAIGIDTATAADVQQMVRDSVDPASAGFVFTNLRVNALKATSQSMDFGSLFLSMSFFLVVASAVLTGLLFVFGIEQRSCEIGTLLAAGWLKSTIGRVLMIEGFLLAIVGSAVGCLLGVMYTYAILHALNTVWLDAVTSAKLQFHAGSSTIAVGFTISVAIAVMTMWLALGKNLKRPVCELLAGHSRLQTSGQSPAKISRWTATISMLGAIIMLWLTRGDSGAQAAGAFFGVGALLLISAIATCRVVLSATGSWGTLSLSELAFRQATRRRGQSMAVITLIACGSFMVIAVGANRHAPGGEQFKKLSGNGGYRLFGETTLPLLYDLNREEGRDAFAIDGQDMLQVNIVPMRLRDGDDASCLNLNSARSPRLLGVDPSMLVGRFGDVDWSILDHHDDGFIPVIGDDATITWSLYKKVGDTLDYVTESGQTVKLRIVGVIPNSIFQGSLVIGESNFQKLFPSHSGHHVLLVDVPGLKAMNVAAKLTHALSDLGIEITPTNHRLAMFNRVQNTYLSIFAALGGLGLILGSVGLGAVVLRNMLERRAELAVLGAIGFTRRRIFWLILLEHGLLLETGLACGTASAIVAVWPAIGSNLAEIPYVFLIFLITAIWLSGLAWVGLAAMLSMRGRLLHALRSE